MSEAAKPATWTAAPAAAMPGALRRYGIWIAAAVIFVILPHIFTSGTAMTVMSLMGIAIIFALSYNMLLGQTGMLSFGHAVYYGLGAFCAVHVMNLAIRQVMPMPLALIPLVGGLGGLLFGVIFGSVSTKRGGIAFAMISLGLAELVNSSAFILRGFFGGEEGVTTNRTKLLHLFDWTFGPQIQVYYLIAAWCLLCMVAMYALTRTPFGRMCNAVRDNPERAQFVGYNPQTVRFIAFCLSAFFAGIAGGLAAINYEIVNASYVGLGPSGTVLIAAYLGGIGYFVGPVIGAVVVTYLQLMLSDASEIWQLYFGLLFIAVVAFAPGGIASLIMRHAPLWRARVVHRLVPAYLLAFVPLLATLAGISLVIEMTFRLTVKASDPSAMAFFHVPLDAATVPPWIVALVLIAGGYWLFRRTWPIVDRAWTAASAAAKTRGDAR